MCGIAGIASFSDNHVGEDQIGRMTGVLKHRGPDDEGFYISRLQDPASRLRVNLGHRRLSIIDIEGGHQPMTNEDKTIWIVYGGEVYNFPELREWLTAKGHRFTTKSDTEVIIHLYEEKGVDCLNDLRGMFAFCIWDIKKQSLFLARDRVGQKPLFYFCQDGVFLFGSEIKAILEHDALKRELDTKSLDGYFTYGYIPAPRTMFKGIRQLMPAHYLVHDGKDIKIKRYWRLSYGNKTPLSLPECEEKLYGLLTEATRMRLISDVPLGALLSGGVDSSCIVALMSGLSKNVKTFSIGFENEKFDELKHAKLISERFGTEHQEFIVRPNAVEILPKLAWYYDQPFGDSSCIPMYYISRETRNHVTVALTGDGGDESFAGYRKYIGTKLLDRNKWWTRYVPKHIFKSARR
ncbi:asparagine synthase (glutamine-hydrolyzing), partial [Omnitrophica bacterium]|nr:asparagine synthase (glutamine-hydrolyzing) [Candidatus Omnitrophota bacterium]